MDEGGIYTSTNGGTSWTQTAAPISIYWRSIASSSDGSKLAAVYTDYEDYIQRGRVYTSTDRGISWTHQTAMWLNRYKEIASSSDGSMLAVDTGGDGVIWKSNDGGYSWTYTNSLYATGIACSSDGSMLFSINPNGGFQASYNGGVSWRHTSDTPSCRDCSSIASSSDGSKLAAVVNRPYNNFFDSGIYISTNGGIYWTRSWITSSKFWRSIASSSDGSKLAAVVQDGGIYTSTNGGTSWTLTTAPNPAQWRKIASSSDGLKLAALIYNYSQSCADCPYFGGIYTSTNGGVDWKKSL